MDCDECGGEIEDGDEMVVAIAGYAHHGGVAVENTDTVKRWHRDCAPEVACPWDY